MPEATSASTQVLVKIENLELKIPDVFSFSKGDSVSSEPVGPTGSFQIFLRVYPSGLRSEESDSRHVAAAIHILPPKHLKDSWSCPDVRVWIWVERNNNCEAMCSTMSFDQTRQFLGWSDILGGKQLQDFVTSDGELRVKAQVWNLPYVQPPTETSEPLFPGLKFSTEAKMLNFRLAEGPSLFFDQRLLMARSEYFQKMLTSDEWQESRKGEVDFTSDPHVTNELMETILEFILTDSFQVGSVEFNLEVRKLADRFCLKSLVEKVDAAMKDMLNEDNVLQILAEMHDTDSVVEKSCWSMLESDCTILAKHQDQLDSLVAEPTLAKKLILLGTKRRRRN
eukprot:s1917_g12.t1